ncbi:VOC family protein [Bacillus sp. AFS040349]|uniref:VOC family protein n=1 Tax=Bacillus sp. AFS040349 TaxID=2033502 RepID=UPI00159BB9C1|nr:hypothetical protein [Bacillus sp. AFS040349]
MSLNVQKIDLQKADISGLKWQEVNAEELEIDNVSLAKTKVNNANMNSMLLNDVNLEKVEIFIENGVEIVDEISDDRPVGDHFKFYDLDRNLLEIWQP